MYFIPPVIKVAHLREQVLPGSYTPQLRPVYDLKVLQTYDILIPELSETYLLSENSPEFQLPLVEGEEYLVNNTPRIGFRFICVENGSAKYLHPLGFVFATTPATVNYLLNKLQPITEQPLVIVFSKKQWYLVHEEDLAGLKDYVDASHPKYPMHLNNLEVGRFYASTPEGRPDGFYVGLSVVNGVPLHVFAKPGSHENQVYVQYPLAFKTKGKPTYASAEMVSKVQESLIYRGYQYLLPGTRLASLPEKTRARFCEMYNIRKIVQLTELLSLLKDGPEFSAEYLLRSLEISTVHYRYLVRQHFLSFRTTVINNERYWLVEPARGLGAHLMSPIVLHRYEEEPSSDDLQTLQRVIDSIYQRIEHNALLPANSVAYVMQTSLGVEVIDCE